MRRGERRFEGRIVIVHTFDGPSFQGVLTCAHREAWTLAGVTHMDSDQALKGEITIPRVNGYLQYTGKGA